MKLNQIKGELSGIVERIYRNQVEMVNEIARNIIVNRVHGAKCFRRNTLTIVFCEVGSCSAATMYRNGGQFCNTSNTTLYIDIKRTINISLPLFLNTLWKNPKTSLMIRLEIHYSDIFSEEQNCIHDNEKLSIISINLTL